MIHLLESTGFAALVPLLIFLLRVRRPATRHVMWMMAILKFAQPASLLGSLGSHVRALFSAPITIVLANRSMPSTLAAGVIPAPHASWNTALLVVWLAGFLWALGRWIGRLATHSIPGTAASTAEIELLDRLRKTAGVRGPVALRHSARPLAPGLAGFWKPVIVIQENLATELEAGEFQAVLLHELAHVRRADNFWSAAAHVVTCLFWFHPLLWWLERRAVEESEQACDELVVRWGATPDGYAQAILKVCRQQIAVSLAGVSGIGSGLSGRIERILAQPAAGSSSALSRCAPAVLAAVLAGAPFAAGLLTRPVLYARVQEVQAPPAVAPKVSASKPPAARPPQCWHTAPYPVGTVLRVEARVDGQTVNAPYDQMCVVDEKGQPRWVKVTDANRPQAAEPVIVPPPDPDSLVCKPAVSKSPRECMCANGRASSLGAVLNDDQGGKVRCDKWLLRPTAEWRPYVPGKDDQ
jgi:beta-lactamase regulating signal transducer with metallopeptidase domain